MEKNLGHATAYGYAKSKGYTGTEEEFGVLMASYASVAQDASQSASSAAESAQLASNEAQRASQSATSAHNDAETASNIKTDVESARDTTVDAKNATVEAKNISVEAKNSAISAKDTAESKAQIAEAWAVGQKDGTDVPSTDETYHNNAKYYSEQADIAKIGAESAQQLAQASATSASESASDASTSAQTASQAAQTATSKASEATTAATTATTKASEASTSAGTASTAAQTATNKASEATTAATTATTKASEANQSAQTASTAKTNAETARDAAAQSASEAANSAIEAAQSAQSVDAERLNRVAFGSYVTESASGAIASFPDGADNIPMKDVLVHIEPVQAGSGDPSPDNVRPITGWTGAKVTRCGKNLLPPYKDASKETFGITFTNDNGRYTVNGTSTARTGIDISVYLPAGTYTLAGFESLNNNMSVYILTADIEVLANITLRNNAVRTFTINKDASIVRFTVAGNVTISNGTANLEIVKGTVAPTEWEPYSGQTYDITFPTEAGTVYGGTLDVTKGELVVDRSMVDLGTLDLSLSSVTSSIGGAVFSKQISTIGMAKRYRNTPNTVLSSVFATAPTERWFINNMLDNEVFTNETTVYFSASQYSDASAFKAAMSGVQFCYKLATPITYTLTPQEITSLLGTNNLWADTGNSEVEYCVDPTLLLDNESSEIQSIKSMIAGVESSAVATKNYSIGDLVIVGDTLYEVTAAIASGETISVSKARVTTVDDTIKNRIVAIDNVIENRIADSIDATLTKSGQAADAKAVGDLKNAITETLSGVTWTDGYISYPNGSITSSSNYQYSSPIDIGCGRIAVTLTDDTSVAVLAKFDAVANRYTALLAGDGTAYHKQYTYDVTDPGQYVISYRKPNGISDISLAILPENVSVLRDTLDDRTLCIDGISFEQIEGSFVKLDGAYANSTSYAHTRPLYLLPGDYVIAAYATPGVSIVALSDKDGNNRTCAIESNPLVSNYSLHVTTAGYYIFSYRIAEGLVISKQYNVKDQIALVDDKLDDNALVTLNRYKSDLIVPNLSIKAFKTLNYTDGTTDKYTYVLWNDEVNDAFYMSDGIYSEKHKIFDWNSVIAGNYDSSYYQALILPNGDILFVFQTQFVSPSDSTAEGSYRQNPLICRASNGFRLEVIDFGSGVKPTGWLQNVGAIYSYAHNRVFIAEYTRANEKYARIWAVDMPVTTISNWHIVLEKEIPTPYQTGFKHFHSCQQDPYTGILYFSSGDNDLSSAVWYSTDGGDTLVQLDDYNAGKYRMLNMAFTKEYVYWASDQWSPNHFLWRIKRDENTGVLDVTTLTKLLTFDDERVDGVSRIATYTTVYMSAYNCLMILDRDDGGNHPKIPVRVYDIPSGNLYTVAELLPIASGVTAGFRNVAITCYTKSNEVACSFDKRLLNNNRMLGNNSTNRINNLVIRLYKSDNAIQKVVTPLSWTDGYITNNGAIISSDRYKYSSPFDVEEGRISVELTDDSNVAVFSSYDEQSGTYTPLVFGVGTGVHKVYEYNVTNPGKYVISYRTPNGIGDIKVIEKDADFNIEFDTVY